MSKLRDCYLMHRHPWTSKTKRVRMTPAYIALRMARATSAGVTCYPRKIYPAAGKPFGRDHLRWLAYDEPGFRIVGFADEIANLDNSGWYNDEFGESITRGVVFQLSGRNGESRFLEGIATGSITKRGFVADGYAFNCRDIWHEKTDSPRHSDECEDAARAADATAERYAELEREYSEVSGARCEFLDRVENEKQMRGKILALAKEKRGLPDATRAEICGRIRHYYREIQESRKRREDLELNYSGHVAWQES